MALTPVAMVLVGAAAVVGCSPYGGGAFHCETSDQCAGGTCEPEGLCSFPDATCPSGKRFGELGGSLGGVCVGAATTDGSMPDTDTPPDDGATDTMIDMATALFCDAANEPTLVGCWEFEGNANDASGDGNDAMATGVGYAIGKVGMAIVLEATSTLVVGERASLEPPHLTVEAWVNPSQTPPSSGRWGLIDTDGAYGLFITASNISCSMGGTLTVPATIAASVWTHVACTNDGTTVRIYIDGIPSTSTAGGGALGTGNANGTVLAGNSPTGDNFAGSLDQFRVFNEARTQEQICAATGLATCK